MAEHNLLSGSQLHEPKHFAEALGTDAGKVLTPSDADGVSELRSLSIADVGIPENRLLQHYGSMQVLQNDGVGEVSVEIPYNVNDDTLYHVDDYLQLNPTNGFTEWEAGVTEGITFADGELSVTQDGLYFITGWASVGLDVTNTLLGFKYTINGAPSPSAIFPTVRRFVSSTADVGVVAASGLVSLSSGDSLGIAATSSITSGTKGNLQLADASITLSLFRAT